MTKSEETTENAMTSRSYLHTLRSLMPARALSFPEALQRAELQASRLLELSGITDGPVPDSVITDQPRIVVENTYLPSESGVSTWERGAWRIQLSALEPEVRRRFTLAHELKHVLDAPIEQIAYARLRSPGDTHPLVEQVCDYFAACLLMPKKFVKRTWGEGLRDVQSLAAYFDVSPQAMQIRLQTLGLVERPARCRTPSQLVQQRRQPARPRTYWRAASPAFAGAMP